MSVSACGTTSVPASQCSRLTCTRTRTLRTPCPRSRISSISAWTGTKRPTASRGSSCSAPHRSRSWAVPATSTSTPRRNRPSDVFFPDVRVHQHRDQRHEIKHTNLYAYSYVSLPSNLTLTLGVSGDLFDETGTAISNTLIAGFPLGEPAPITGRGPRREESVQPQGRDHVEFQVRYHAPGRLVQGPETDADHGPDAGAHPGGRVQPVLRRLPARPSREVWGAALDQKFGKKAFGGAEYSQRDLTIPQTLLLLDPGRRNERERGDQGRARATWRAPTSSRPPTRG